MLQCEVCDDWFHISCIGLSDDDAQQLSTYICKGCGDGRPALSSSTAFAATATSVGVITASPAAAADVLDLNASDNDGDAVYCICRRPEVEGEEMIQCDDCAVSVLATTAVCPKLKALAGRSS